MSERNQSQIVINNSPNSLNKRNDSLDRRSVDRNRDKLKFHENARNIISNDQNNNHNLYNPNTSYNIESPSISNLAKINPMLQSNVPLDESIIFDKNSPVGIDFNNLEAKQFEHADQTILNVFKSINAQRPGFLNFLGNKKQDANNVLAQYKRFNEPLNDVLNSTIGDDHKIDIIYNMANSNNF